MENVCRTCLDNRVTLVNIFSKVTDPTLEQPEKNLSYILSECTNRSVRRDDGQPQFICLTCVRDAQNSFRFKKQCDRSYQLFWELENKSYPPEWVLEGDQDQEEAEQKGDPNADAYRPNSCPQKSSRYCGTNTSKREQSQPINETKRKQIKLPNTEEKRYGSPRIYKTIHGLIRHVATHVSKPTYKCPSWSRAFWRSDSYIGHLNINDKDGPHACSQCSYVFPYATQLEMHRLEHKKKTETGLYPGHSCDLCSKSFIREENLRIHKILNHHIRDMNSARKYTTLLREPQNLDLSLKYSKVDYSSMESSDDHPTSKQNESGFDQDTTSSGEGEKQLKQRFRCPHCQRSYTDKKKMKRHLVTHISKPKYNCIYCSQAFWRKYRLIRHLRTHEEEGPLSCSQCTAVFIDAFQLERHRQEHNEKTIDKIYPVAVDLDSEENDDESELNNMINYKINGETSLDAIPESFSEDLENDAEDSVETSLHASPKSFSMLEPKCQAQIRNRSLESSIIDDSIIESVDDHSTSRQNESGFDQDTSSEQGEKKINLYNTEKRFGCPHCSRTYKNKKGLTRHLDTHNSKPKYNCPQCPKAFWRSDHLLRHLRTHGTQRRYSCSQCSAAFIQRCSLARHYRNIHKMGNAVKCSYCSKEYRSKQSLKRHERVHSGELFRCRLCPKGFIEKNLLHRHEKNMHQTKIDARKVSHQTAANVLETH